MMRLIYRFFYSNLSYPKDNWCCNLLCVNYKVHQGPWFKHYKKYKLIHRCSFRQFVKGQKDSLWVNQNYTIRLHNNVFLLSIRMLNESCQTLWIALTVYYHFALKAMSAVTHCLRSIQWRKHFARKTFAIVVERCQNKCLKGLCRGCGVLLSISWFQEFTTAFFKTEDVFIFWFTKKSPVMSLPHS